MVHQGSGYVLRLYDPFIALEAEYSARADGYDSLASYFDGAGNADGVRFAESQPVILNYLPDGSKRMQLFVGATREGKTVDPPAPTVPGTRLVGAGGELCAVLPFGGYITPESAGAAVRELKALLAQDGFALAQPEVDGLFRVCQYGPIFSFSGRENEVLLRVQM